MTKIQIAKLLMNIPKKPTRILKTPSNQKLINSFSCFSSEGTLESAILNLVVSRENVELAIFDSVVLGKKLELVIFDANLMCNGALAMPIDLIQCSRFARLKMGVDENIMTEILLFTKI